MSNKPLPNSIVSIYANLLPRIREAARPLGWAIGVHGSLVNDMDLMAMPWIDDAASEEDLIAAIVEACKPSVPFLTPEATTWMSLPTPKDMPHGRRSWAIHYGGTVYIDLCVMPRRSTAVTEPNTTKPTHVESDGLPKCHVPGCHPGHRCRTCS